MWGGNQVCMRPGTKHMLRSMDSLGIAARNTTQEHKLNMLSMDLENRCWNLSTNLSYRSFINLCSSHMYMISFMVATFQLYLKL